MHFCIVVWLQTYGGQGVECGGLNKNDPTGSQGVVLLGGVALLEEVCHWGGLCVSLGWALCVTGVGFDVLEAQACSPFAACGTRCRILSSFRDCVCLDAAMLPTMMTID